MRNFGGIKALRDCGPEDLVPGTCFELLVGAVPVRRGVVCRTSPVMAWFQMKSASADCLFPIDGDLTSNDVAQLVIRAVPNYDDFVRKVPSKVRAQGCSRAVPISSKKQRPSSTDECAIHPDLQGPSLIQGASARRATTDSPGCSPPTTPRGKRSKKNPSDEKPVPVKKTVMAVIESLEERVSDLTHVVEKLRRRIKKGPKASSGKGRVDVDWS